MLWCNLERMNNRIIKKTPLRLAQHRPPSSEVNSIVITFDESEKNVRPSVQNSINDLSDDESHENDDNESQFSLISHSDFREMIDCIADIDSQSTTSHTSVSSFFISTAPGFQTPQSKLVLEIIRKNNELKSSLDEIKNLRDRFKDLAFEKSELLKCHGPVLCCSTVLVENSSNTSSLLVNSTDGYLTLRAVSKNVGRTSVSLDEFFQSLEILHNVQLVKKLVDDFESCLSIMDSSVDTHPKNQSSELEILYGDSIDYSTVLASLMIQKLNFVTKNHYLLRETKILPKDNPRILQSLEMYETLSKIRSSSQSLQSHLNILTSRATEIHACLLILYKKLSFFADKLSISSIVTETYRLTKKCANQSTVITSTILLQEALCLLATSIQKTLFKNTKEPSPFKLTVPKLCSPSFFSELVDLIRSEISSKNDLSKSNDMWILKKIK